MATPKPMEGGWECRPRDQNRWTEVSGNPRRHRNRHWVLRGTPRLTRANGVHPNHRAAEVNQDTQIVRTFPGLPGSGHLKRAMGESGRNKRKQNKIEGREIKFQEAGVRQHTE